MTSRIETIPCLIQTEANTGYPDIRIRMYVPEGRGNVPWESSFPHRHFLPFWVSILEADTEVKHSKFTHLTSQSGWQLQFPWLRLESGPKLVFGTTTSALTASLTKLSCSVDTGSQPCLGRSDMWWVIIKRNTQIRMPSSFACISEWEGIQATWVLIYKVSSNRHQPEVWPVDFVWLYCLSF
jgi:hypothetical protein